MNLHDDYRGIEQHLLRARQMRSAVLGLMIGGTVAEAWLGIVRGYRWIAKKVLHLAHALPTAPIH